jgi:hypothetical protein
MFDANGIAVVSRRWRLALAVLHALRQYSNADWIEKKLTKASYMKLRELFQPVEKTGKMR